jgi:hypothetical protein
VNFVIIGVFIVLHSLFTPFLNNLSSVENPEKVCYAPPRRGQPQRISVKARTFVLAYADGSTHTFSTEPNDIITFKKSYRLPIYRLPIHLEVWRGDVIE